jgi:hypothetical protein
MMCAGRSGAGAEFHPTLYRRRRGATKRDALSAGTIDSRSSDPGGRTAMRVSLTGLAIVARHLATCPIHWGTPSHDQNQRYQRSTQYTPSH